MKLTDAQSLNYIDGTLTRRMKALNEFYTITGIDRLPQHRVKQTEQVIPPWENQTPRRKFKPKQPQQERRKFIPKQRTSPVRKFRPKRRRD